MQLYNYISPSSYKNRTFFRSSKPSFNLKQLSKKTCLKSLIWGLSLSLSCLSLAACQSYKAAPSSLQPETTNAAKPLLSDASNQALKWAEPTATIDPANLDWHTNTELRNLIERYIEKKNFKKEHIAIELRNYQTKDHYSLNEDKYFVAASTYKFYLATIYYDLIAKGKVQASDMYRLDSNEVEPGGVLDSSAKVGDKIAVKDLLQPMLIYSDNTAGHMLFEELGGWTAFKKLAATYVDVNQDQNYLSLDNIVNARFLADFADLIYEDQTKYSEMLDYLKQAEPQSYQNYLPIMHNVMAQKYGRYELACNAVGLLFDDPKPYSLVILTDMSGYGERVIGELSALVYAYYHPDRLNPEVVLVEAPVLNYVQPKNVWYTEGDRNDGSPDEVQAKDRAASVVQQNLDGDNGANKNEAATAGNADSTNAASNVDAAQTQAAVKNVLTPPQTNNEQTP